MGAATKIALAATAALFLLNIADACLTLAAVPDRAEEVNPVAAHLLSQGPVVFVSVKILMVSAALAWAWWRISTRAWPAGASAVVMSLCALGMTGVVGMLVVALIIPA
jgi:hypothetical protein